LRYIDGETPILTFLLTYKLSQDHLELFFGVLRRHGGNNDNPTTQQFNAAYKRTLIQRDLNAPTTGNCSAVDGTYSIATQNIKDKQPNLMPVLAYQQFDEFEEDENDDEDLTADLGLIQKNVTTYIGGALTRAVQGKISCETCRASFFGNEKDPCEHVDLIRWKDRGGLIYPSTDLQTLCLAAEENFRVFEAKGSLQQNYIKKKLMVATKQKISSSLFLIAHDKDGDEEIDPVEHREICIDEILNYYFNTKLHYAVKKLIENVKRNASLKRNKTRKFLHNLGV
jgi:hypothetical protein